jgi:hypothetical protein
MVDFRSCSIMVDTMSYPIKDIQHHEQALRDMDGEDMSSPEVVASVRYHVTAICALQLGSANDIDGPAYEFSKDGKVIVRQIEDEFLKIDGEHGPEFLCVPLGVKTND